MNKIGSNPVRGALLRSSLLRLGDTANPYIEGCLGFNAGLDGPREGGTAGGGLMLFGIGRVCAYLSRVFRSRTAGKSLLFCTLKDVHTRIIKGSALNCSVDSYVGHSPSGKARDFDSRIHQFESGMPSLGYYRDGNLYVIRLRRNLFMAMGDSYNRNNTGTGNNRSNIDQTFYSRLRIKNDSIAQTLNFSFWRGLLKLSINNVPRSADEKIEELAYIHLSPNKAFIFAECVKYIIDNPETFDIKGVDTGIGETRGMLVIGRDMGKPYLIIAKVNKDGGYDSQLRFDFNWDYNYYLDITNITPLQFKKTYDNNAELEQLYHLLVDYARSSSGAYAYSTYDVGRYEAAKFSNMVKAIADKVGVESGNGNGGNRSYTRSNESYFSGNNGGGSSNNSSSSQNSSRKYQNIDDLEDEFD